MEQKRKFWRTVKVEVTPKTKKFFGFCSRKGYVLSKKLTELIEIYADYIVEKEKMESAKEADEIKEIFKKKGV